MFHLLARFLALPALLVSAASLFPAASDQVILDMDTIRHRPLEVTDAAKNKVPVGTVELVDGTVGKAVKFSFTPGLGAGFMTASVQAKPEWDRAQGISFYVKGDGSTNWGGLEMIDKSNYALRYAYAFPLDSTDWKKIEVRWADLTPELSGPLVDASNGYAPSGFGNLWFGKWHYWRNYPAHSFVIDQVTLAPQLPAPPIYPALDGLKRFAAKLKMKQPVTIVTMGDSLSDKRHWANRELLWSEAFARAIKSQFGSDVSLLNPAIGGTTLSQNLVLMPQWSRLAPAPDLVTVWFGFNDWDSGVRGPRFKQYLQLAVERIARQTRGTADILLLTTCPAHARWETMKELEQAVRDVAQENKTALADIAEVFRRVETPDKALTQTYWAWDKTHLGKKGHEVVAQTLLQLLTDKPGAVTNPLVPPAKP